MPERPKAFAWSYSKLKNFETCQYRHQQIDIEKTVSEDESDELREGNEAHAVLAAAIGRGVPLPSKWIKYQPWVDRITPGSNDDIIVVEQQLAIAEDKGPCEWFAKGKRPAWYRAKVDVLKIVGPVALAIDWKTGKRVEDSVQLALNAACIFAHYPGIRAIRTEFVWLKEGVTLENTSREDFTPADMPDLWGAVMPRVDALKHAYDTGTYAPMPGRLCKKWCPVSMCPYWGKSF